jgi:hypothetical protein
LFRIVSAEGIRTNYHLDPFPQGNRDSLTDNSTPSSRSWAGVASNVPISKIRREGTDIAFRVSRKICPDPELIVETNLSETICEGDSIFFASTWLKTAGTYTAVSIKRNTTVATASLDFN